MTIDINTEFTGLDGGIYYFDLMETQLIKLVREYPFLTLGKIGESTQQRILYCLSLGSGKRKIHVNGSHHANEWITSCVIMKSVEVLCRFIRHRRTCFGIEGEKLLQRVTFDFVPMVNPDGVNLCTKGVKDEKYLDNLIKMNAGSDDFSRWKANIRGVDLNRNYNAGFNDYAAISEAKYPSYAYYQGEKPESEPETKALIHLTKARDYDLAFAYHTQGEVIYWTYQKLFIKYANEYAKLFSKVSGYQLDEPGPQAASGGYKDWFMLHFKKPGFTIECGRGENPIDSSQLDTILIQTFPILLMAAKDLRERENDCGSL